MNHAKGVLNQKHRYSFMPLTRLEIKRLFFTSIWAFVNRWCSEGCLYWFNHWYIFQAL